MGERVAPGEGQESQEAAGLRTRLVGWDSRTREKLLGVLEKPLSVGSGD